MKKLMRGLAGIVLSAAALTAVNYSCCSRPSVIVEVPEIKITLENRQEQIRQATRSYLRKFIRSYVEEIMPFSGEVRGNVDYYNRQGKDGKAEVTEGYFQIYDSCLSVAARNVGGVVPESEIRDLSKRLVTIHKNMARVTDLDLSHPSVENPGYVKFGVDRVGRFKRIMERNQSTSAVEFVDLYRAAFNQQEAEKDFEALDRAEADLFETFKESLGLKRIFGSGIIDQNHRKSREINFREYQKAYSDLKIK